MHAHRLLVARGVGLVLEHEDVAVLLQQLHVGSTHGLECVGAIGRRAATGIAFGGCLEGARDDLEASVHCCVEKVELRREQAEHIRLGDAHFPCHVAHWRSVQPAVGRTRGSRHRSARPGENHLRQRLIGAPGASLSGQALPLARQIGCFADSGFWDRPRARRCPRRVGHGILCRPAPAPHRQSDVKSNQAIFIRTVVLHPPVQVYTALKRIPSKRPIGTGLWATVWPVALDNPRHTLTRFRSVTN
ncbi:MAG: hypothetical protein JWO21_1282 [Solirubrobacterales bacterium]|nr:hypothetical protein [Solirubrobacterales bacterium]